ncbi:putative membrane protein [Vibrio harveyi]|uniref:Putative membrane protein n=2 Tax=Vibrionaceae TaxID=641 RepID=A0A454D400_VIBHA|nr:putative membrane protein [Vibrio harveyi]
MADWFVLQGMSNTSILYMVSFLAYAFDLSVKGVVWWMAGLLVLYTVYEFWRVLVVAKRPEFKASALRTTQNANKAFKSDS